MTGSSYACTCTAFRSISTKLAARSSGGRRSAVAPSAGGPPLPPPPVVMAGAVASPGKRVPPSPTGCTSRAASGVAVSASATVAAPASSSRQAKEDDGASRNVSGFEPSIWGDFFLTYSSPLATSSLHKAWMVHRAEQLKEQVAAKLVAASSSACSLHRRIHLIHVLERLCLDHLFEDEISGMLSRMNDVDVSGCDLQTVAMWFYLLRKHGYMVSSDVFAEFRDEQGGGFTANSARDLLSLHCAACLATRGETILDEAISFTTKSLKSTAPYTGAASLACEINRALEIPLPRRVRIYEAKSRIAEYGREAEADELVMELAKLNYNLVQLQYQQELKIVTRWWNGLELQSRLSFARDRVVECYFWIVGVYFEPSYSRARIILTKVIAIVSLLDDTYDVYGTPQECELFTECIESWDPAVAGGLPENMKFIFGKFLDTYQSIEEELVPEEKYRMPYIKNFIIDLVRAYNKEVRWREQGYVPATVEEHLQVSARSGACHLLSCASFVGMGDVAGEEAFEWVCSVPKLVQALCIILRLSDDLKSYEREKMAPHVASTIESCMREHEVPLEVARVKIQEMIDETWKDFNEEWLNMNKHQPAELLERIFNLTRTMVYMYQHDDAYTNCHVIKDTINSLFVEPVSIA
uniref:Sesquiterpene cyclase n=1 Tax=Zea mays TaxID=4577 RepID=A0EVF2_MAIZE|nr:sesquiterpene cyclase [Zea mays]